MNNFSTNYRKILDILEQLEPKKNFLNQIRKSKLSDIELIAIDITAEYMSIDSEYQLFRKLPMELSSLIERSVYNRRRRKLFFSSATPAKNDCIKDFFVRLLHSRQHAIGSVQIKQIQP